MPPPAWRLRDEVWSVALRKDDPDRYRAVRLGRIIAIRDGVMKLDSGRTFGVTEVPAFRSREDCEAWIGQNPGPNVPTISQRTEKK